MSQRMRRLLSSLSALVLVIGLSACGDGEDNGNGGEANGSDGPEAPDIAICDRIPADWMDQQVGFEIEAVESLSANECSYRDEMYHSISVIVEPSSGAWDISKSVLFGYAPDAAEVNGFGDEAYIANYMDTATLWSVWMIARVGTTTYEVTYVVSQSLVTEQEAHEATRTVMTELLGS